MLTRSPSADIKLESVVGRCVRATWNPSEVLIRFADMAPGCRIVYRQLVVYHPLVQTLI